MPLISSNGNSSTNSSSFWKEKQGARPGKVAGAGGGGPVRGKQRDKAALIVNVKCLVPSGGKTEKAANTFQAYQASVSDAWDIEVRLFVV